MAFTGFQYYTQEELEVCGQAFQQDFCLRPSTRRTCDWTQQVHGWFAEKAAPSARVFDHKREQEFIFDHCHLSFPKVEVEPDWHKRWQLALDLPNSCEILLALESEWGKENNRNANLASVLDDALKLAVVRARAKVMVFASHVGWEDQAPIVQALNKLRKAAADGDPWLWIDVPWLDNWKAEGRCRKISYGVISGAIS